MTINRCSNCDADPRVGVDPGEDAMDGWAFASVECPKCGDTVIEHVPLARMIDANQGLAELEQSVIKTWNEKHRRNLG
jgi:hypothetical protein